MQNTFFLNKNILYLLPTDENQYLNFLYEELRKYLANIYRLDVVGYFNQNGLKNTVKYIENLISNKKIDILISSPFATEYQLSVEFYVLLKNKVKIVFWFGDDEMYFDSYNKYYSQVANAVITTDYFSVFAYKKLGVPAICYFDTRSKSDYYPVEVKKDIDVCFLGDCTKSDRMEYIIFLIKNGIDIRTFGKGSKNGFVDWGKQSEIFSRSKVNLNFTKIDILNWINRDEPILNRIKQNKGRLIEIALTKSFCLTEYAPSINIYFEIGKEIDVFHNKKELLEKVKYYLSNETKRKEMAENAYKRVINNYVPKIVFPKVLKELGEILEKNNKQKTEKIKIYLSRAFKIKSINSLTFSVFIMLKNKKIFYALELFIKLFRYGFFIFFAGFYGGLVRVLKNITAKIS
ncbi:MAG: glycosyltransferase [Elusimicrobiota bacterium]